MPYALCLKPFRRNLLIHKALGPECFVNNKKYNSFAMPKKNKVGCRNS